MKAINVNKKINMSENVINENMINEILIEFKKIIPDFSKKLPIAENMSEIAKIIINNKISLITAMTGSGKTILIPLFLKFITDDLIIIREPTRQTTRNMYNFYKEMYGDYYKIAIKTSEDKLNLSELDNIDILFITDGVFSRIHKLIKRRFSVVYDEVHLIDAPFELEMGIVRTLMEKDERINKVIYLTATISPKRLIKWIECDNECDDDINNYIENISDEFVKYMMSSIIKTQIGYDKNILSKYSDNKFIELARNQRQKLKLFYIEGITEKVNREIVKFEIPEDEKEGDYLLEKTKEIVIDEINKGKRILVFVPTRISAFDLANQINNEYNEEISMGVNADIDSKKIIEFVEKSKNSNKPCVIFSTIAFATSITFDINEVIILNQRVDSVFENGFVKQYRTYIDGNTIIQMAGRVGRIKRNKNEEPDKVILITDANYPFDKFEEISVNELIPPLEKMSPIDVVLESAYIGVDISKFNILSKLDYEVVEEYMEALKEIGAIERNGKINLTDFGYVSKSIPVSVFRFVIGYLEYQIRNLNDEKEIEKYKKMLAFVVSIASWGEKSLYQLLYNPNYPEKLYEIFKSYAYPFDEPSMFVMRFFITQVAMLHQSKDNKGTSLSKFAYKYGLNNKFLQMVMYNIYKISEYTSIKHWELRKLIMTMTKSDIRKFYNEFVELVNKYDFDYFEVNVIKNGRYYNIDESVYDGTADWGFISKNEVDLFSHAGVFVYSGKYLMKLKLTFSKKRGKTYMIGSDINLI